MGSDGPLGYNFKTLTNSERNYLAISINIPIFVL